MSKTARIFLAVAVIVIGTGGALIFLDTSRDSSPNSTPQYANEILPPNNSSSEILTSSTPKSLLSTSTPILKAPPPTYIISPTPSEPITPPVAPIATTSPSSATNNDPPQINPNPQTIVGILCYYNATYTDDDTGQTIYSPDDEEVRGSGVIINSHGDILTNRHIIEQPSASTTLDDENGNPVPVSVSYQLDTCDVGQLPAGATLPSASEIESINPYIQIPVLGYTAQPIYISQTTGLSDLEVQYADFAVLGITGVSASGPTFGVTSVPESFPYATLLPTQPYPDILNDQVITYGFPGDVTSGQGNFFQTLTMTGSVGTVSNIYDGDQYYANTPLNIATDLAIAHGRSGSPLFWRGYDIGIVTFFIGDNQTDSGSVASDAILKALKGTGYIPGD